MKYIAKVDNTHIVEVSGVNVQIKQDPKKYHEELGNCFHFGEMLIGDDLTVYSGKASHLAKIVVAVEIAKFIQQHEPESTKQVPE
jgi:hypothetical protein